MKIAIVILNWNGKALLQQFLPSVVKYSKQATIYVADNNSDDNSIAFLKNTYPNIKIIKHSVNGGYAKGYNDALNHINADVFCLLNNDVNVTKNWLNPIISTFNSNKNIAVVQPKILDYKNPLYFEYAGAAGGFIDKFGYPYCRGRIFNTIEKDNHQYTNETPIFWASGACLFIKRNVFMEAQGFDTSFFAHMEEIDLCWRVKNLGYSIMYNGHSKVYHLGGGTLANSHPKKTYLNFRNSLYLLVKNADGNLFTVILSRLVLDGIAAVKFLLELKPKHFISILKAHFSFYYALPDLLSKRSVTKNKLRYYQKTSIVWQYFIKNKTDFKDL